VNTNTTEIVHLEKSHVRKVTVVIADAFVNEPGAVATIRKTPEKRLPLLRKHFGAQIVLSLSQGASRCAFLNGELVGAMVVTAPGAEPLSTLDMLKLLPRMLLQSNPGILWRGIRSSMEDERNRPKAPNYCLDLLAVAPNFQGQGIGSAMLTHLTDISDREGILTYLSTTDPKTISFYERHGFEIISETREIKIPNFHMVRKHKTFA
jgi:GNAT superfamily N-acetyltransferase